ncbi:MAG: GHKL domain-containing protein [Tenericutes bacterium]|nr:GHKL domain-containing protein [Mycoplasmatota bacterium]
MKPFVSHLIYLIVFKVYYKESWGKTLLGLAIAFIIVSIAELLFAFSAVNLFKFSPEYLNNTIHGLIFTNICILLVVISINNINKVNIVIKNVMGSFKDKSIATISIVLISSLSIGIFIIYQNFYVETSLSYLILINLFFLGVYVFMIGFFIEKSNNSNLLSKYDQLHEYSKTYEQELVKRSKRQHEYENQLIIIRSMIEEGEDNAVEYINRILKSDEKKNDIKWLTKLTYIPYGGLKGLLYFKLNEMMNKKLNVYLEVSEDLKKKSLWKTYEEDAQDISRIIGVYLDNAIEAASISEEKTIEIQFYLENKNIVFCLGNTFKGKIEESKLDNEGYSSKGKNRGYGLPLVKDLLLKHEELKDERVIVDQYYVQKLIIKPKRK